MCVKAENSMVTLFEIFPGLLFIKRSTKDLSDRDFVHVPK